MLFTIMEIKSYYISIFSKEKNIIFQHGEKISAGKGIERKEQNEYPNFAIPLTITGKAKESCIKNNVEFKNKNEFWINGTHIANYDKDTKSLDIYKKPGNENIIMVDCKNSDNTISKIIVNFQTGLAEWDDGGPPTRFDLVHDESDSSENNPKKIIDNLLKKYPDSVSKMGLRTLKENEIAIRKDEVKGDPVIFSFENGKFVCNNYKLQPPYNKPLTVGQLKDYIKSQKKPAIKPAGSSSNASDYIHAEAGLLTNTNLLRACGWTIETDSNKRINRLIYKVKTDKVVQMANSLKAETGNYFDNFKFDGDSIEFDEISQENKIVNKIALRRVADGYVFFQNDDIISRFDD